MSKEITIRLKIPGTKGMPKGAEFSMKMNRDATLRDILIQDFKKDKWIKQNSASFYQNCIGVMFVFCKQKIGSESLDKKLSDLEIKNGSDLWIVFAKANSKIIPPDLIKFDFFEKNNDLLLDSTTNNLEINGMHKNKNKNKKSNIKRRSKLRITLAVLDVLSFIAFILTIYFHVMTVVSVVLFVAFLILMFVVINWNDMVSKDYKDIPCDFFRVVLKRKIEVLK